MRYLHILYKDTLQKCNVLSIDSFIFIFFINTIIFLKSFRVMVLAASVKMGGFLAHGGESKEHLQGRVWWMWHTYQEDSMLVELPAENPLWALECGQEARQGVLRDSFFDLWREIIESWKNWYSPASVTTATSKNKVAPGVPHTQDILLGVCHASFPLITLQRCSHESPFHRDDQVLIR